MTASTALASKKLPWEQIVIVLVSITLANAYYWLITSQTAVGTSSIVLATIGGLVFMLPIQQWRYTLPTIVAFQILSCNIFAVGETNLMVDFVTLAGGFCIGYIPKYMTKLWSPRDFDGYIYKYIPAGIPAFIAYSISLLMLHVLRYGNDFMIHFQSFDDVLLHINLLEFTIVGEIMFIFLLFYQAPQYYWQAVKQQYLGISAAVVAHLAILYLLPDNFFIIIVTLLATVYLYGTVATTLATVIAAVLAPFALAMDGGMYLEHEQFTIYAVIVFIIGMLSLMRDAFVYAAHLGKPFTLSLSQSGNIGLTMVSPEVDALRTKLEQQSEEITQANKDLEQKNAKLFNLTKSLELQKQTYKHLVEIDELTNLKSRRYFANQMADGVRDRPFFLLMIDLDNFKSVNDIYGHHAGDLLLKACAKIFHHSCDELSFAARLGGEEFCIALHGRDMEEAVKFADGIRKQISKTIINLHNVEIARSISVGIANLDVDDQLKDVMSQADAALYQAKEAGKNCIRVADQAFIENWNQERNAPKLDAIINGLENNEFVYYLQPICDIHSGHILGFEALMRWERPDGSVLAPKDFIETVLSRPVYALFKKTSKKQVLPIMQQLANLDESYYLSLNADSTFFHTSRYVTDIINQLQHAGADPKKLIIELPETAQIHNQQLVLQNVIYLREQGIRIALDDFGMEHSNMDRIRDIPADFVKIDRSFIIDLQKNPRSTSIVRALVGMSKELGFDIIAEGIEEQEQADALISAGVTKAQGYFYGEPKPMSYWLEAHEKQWVNQDN
jgi:diguanylate cyclase (GGDEF)-like protein